MFQPRRSTLRSATMRFSSTLSVGNTRRPWGTSPMPLRTVSNEDAAVMSTPLKTILPRRGRLKPTIEFTKQQDFGIAGETDHDLELPLLAVGEITHFGVLAVEEPGAFQEPVRLLVDVSIRGKKPPHHEFRRPQPLDRQQHVVENREPREQAGDLEGARHTQRRTAM